MTRPLLVLFLACTTALSAQQLPRNAAFHPEKDSVAVNLFGKWTLPVPEPILIASVSATVPELTAVRQVKVAYIRRHPHLVFYGSLKGQPETGLYVAVRLKETSPGVYRADDVVQTCTGNPCQSCDFSQNGCVCELYYDPENPLATGSCNHSISRKTPLARIESGKVLKSDY